MTECPSQGQYKSKLVETFRGYHTVWMKDLCRAPCSLVERYCIPVGKEQYNQGKLVFGNYLNETDNSDWGKKSSLFFEDKLCGSHDMLRNGLELYFKYNIAEENLH